MVVQLYRADLETGGGWTIITILAISVRKREMLQQAQLGCHGRLVATAVTAETSFDTVVIWMPQIDAPSDFSVSTVAVVTTSDRFLSTNERERITV